MSDEAKIIMARAFLYSDGEERRVFARALLYVLEDY